MPKLTLDYGRVYDVEYACRDIGYGVEQGNDYFYYDGRETLADKFIFTPTNGGPPIYLFDDEITSIEPGSDTP